ncbi:MAG: exo-alpha-sialidase [Ruminococcaceae bacterium]|nr:exo-alpha-sialidase [Oscillospiraceae bacterium]
MIGKHILDLAPTPENKRNSEGAFLTLRDGSILFVYSRFRNDSALDHAACDLYGMISHDNGDTFGEIFPVLKHEDVDADNVMSVSLLRMKNGDLGLFYGRKKDNDCVYYLIRSSDEGKTWSEPIRTVNEDGYFVLNNDRVVMLKDGAILLPLAYHNKLDDFKPGKLYVSASYDDGYTWETIARDLTMPLSRGLTTGVQEPGILELCDGKLWCYMRTDSGRHYECFSSDGGHTWTDPLPSPFQGPCSPLSAKRLKDGRIVAIWNPIPFCYGRTQYGYAVHTGARSPLVLALSSDDGETFSEPIAIETDDSAGYCYTAIFEHEGAILISYCAGGSGEKTNLARTRIRKIALDELK